MRVSRLSIVLAVLLLAAAANAAPFGGEGQPTLEDNRKTCASLFVAPPKPELGPVAVTHRPTNEEHAKLDEVIPELNRETDLLFHYRADSHTSFIVGDRRVDWGGGFSTHLNRHSVQQGLVIRSVIGKERVDALVKTIDAGEFSGIEAITCAHTELAFLQRNGVRMAGGARFLGSSVYKSVLTQGFADAAGNRFPQQIYTIHPDERFPQWIFDVLVGGQKGWLARFFERVNLSKQDLSLALSPLYSADLVLMAFHSFFGGVAVADSPAASPDAVSLLMFNLEEELIGGALRQYGLDSYALFELFATRLSTVDVATIQAAVRGALHDAALKTRNQLFPTGLPNHFVIVTPP